MSEDEEAMIKSADAYCRFMRENLYWEVLEAADRFERHPWRRRQSQWDADAIGKMCDYLRRVAGDLYLIRQAIVGMGG